jgi:hypothetical protein
VSRHLLTAMVFSIFFTSVGALGQQGPQRDAQALAILTRSLSVAGDVGAIQDFTGTGTITYSWAGEAVQGSVTVTGKGLSQFRMDSSVGGTPQSLVMSGNGGTSLSRKGEKKSLPYHNHLTATSLVFPQPLIMFVLRDGGTTVIDGGIVAWNGAQVQCVHVVPPMDAVTKARITPAGLGSLDFYFDVNSYHLLGFSEPVLAVHDGRQSYVREILFSHYTATHDFLLPFNITEKINGQQTWSMTLDSVSFNTGVADSLFR